MSNLIKRILTDKFLQINEIEGVSTLCLATPCLFKIKQTTVKHLKENYLSDEEIGGILWAKPTVVDGERIFLIEHVNFIRNAIEDTQNKDDDGKIRTRKDAYKPDIKENSKITQEVFSANCLPITFHTHPTKGRNVVENISIQQLQTETSKQDVYESNYTHQLDNDRLLMPRALIVGNSDLSNNIFIGIYNGFIAPVQFELSKKKVQEENLRKFSNEISTTTFSDNQKILLGIGALLLLVAFVKYPKYSFPVILALAATTTTLLTNTETTKNPSYFNKLSVGEVNIYIP